MQTNSPAHISVEDEQVVGLGSEEWPEEGRVSSIDHVANIFGLLLLVVPQCQRVLSVPRDNVLRAVDVVLPCVDHKVSVVKVRFLVTLVDIFNRTGRIIQSNSLLTWA